MGHGGDGNHAGADPPAAVPVEGPISVRVPGKINLFLAVRGRRDDGYHEIVTVLQTVDLHDTVTAELSGAQLLSHHPSARRFMDIELAPHPDLPGGEDNLVVRAAHELLRAIGAANANGDDTDRRPRTRLEIEKAIPIAGGMAGGSADAAAALVALNELWACSLDREELRQVAAQLGADVPFCLQGGTALATGTGAQTAQVLSRGRYSWVVGISDEPLATPAVYDAWDELGQTSTVEPDAVLHALRTADPEALGAALHNDLEAAAIELRPRLGEDREAFLDAGALGAVVSGSGPSILGLASDAVAARELADRVAGRFDRVEVVDAPAGGPELV
ncbi:MAG: 4-(cytidine 5'-diphospho)-2-C-methyl-D-erythritol kinase [Nitriliruptorales bacterium]|nr:4-(cytidine 5'-diphospho)-2-C-methyl-D-erythritol kinase [Nitriliruptorales bacterium]